MKTNLDVSDLTASGRESVLLAERMGMTAHISPLLQKARRLGLSQPADLEQLALTRGLSYFGKPTVMTQISIELFSNEELAVALICPSAPYSINRIRMAAALLAGNSISPRKIIKLAQQERCEPIIKHISKCGMMIEPDRAPWKQLYEAMPDKPIMDIDVLPHVTRFTTLNGLSRDGARNVSQWVRPAIN